MQIATRCEVQSKGSIDAWLKRVEQAVRRPATVDVGMVAGQTPADVAAYAIYNHEGTSRGLPSRPFVRVAFHRYEGQAKGLMRSGLRGAAFGQVSFPQSAATFGAAGVGWIQNVIDSSLGPALAASTVRQKGNSQTLIETGKMRASVSFKVK